jgi:hypothetical protein
MMHCMLETILAARLMGLDPFDQPAVELAKVITWERVAALPGPIRPKIIVGGYAVKLGLVPEIPGAELVADINTLHWPRRPALGVLSARGFKTSEGSD